jgi:hypothetical protein
MVVDPFYMGMAKINGSTELIYLNFGSEPWIYVSSVQHCSSDVCETHQATTFLFPIISVTTW